MSESENPSKPEPTSADEIRNDIEQTRAELAETVDELTDRLNVKSQVGDKASSLKQSTVDKLAGAKASAPPPLQSALDTVGAKAGPIASQVNEKTAPHRGKIAGGAAAAVAALLVVRRARERKRATKVGKRLGKKVSKQVGKRK